MANEIEKMGAKIGAPNGLDTKETQHELTALDWNIQELLERVEGDRQLLLELLGMFHEESHGTMEKANGALSRGDLNELSRIAHGMKGMMKNLAMGAGAEIASVLEKAAAKESQNDSAVQLAKLEHALTLILREVEAQMTELRA